MRSETKPLSNVKINLEGSKLTSVWTDANGNYTFSDLQAGGTYIITPIVSRSFKPSSRTFNDLRRNESADFFGQDDATPTPTPTPTPKHECSETDQIKTLRSFEPSWRRQIQGEQTKIMAENVPKNIEKAEASLGHIEFQYSFPQPCKAAVVMATYEWRISWPANPVSPGKSKSVRKEKSFFCGKLLGFWGCR